MSRKLFTSQLTSYQLLQYNALPKAQELLVKKAASALAPGGHIFIEYQLGGHRITQVEPFSTDDRDNVVWDGTDSDGNHGKMILLAGSYNANTRLSSFTRRFELNLKNSEIIQQDILCHKHFAPLNLLHDWLADAGFIIEQEYSDTRRNPVDENSKGVIIYARKG